MRKIGLLCGIALLFGCSAIIEKIDFELLAETNVWKPAPSERINSCKQSKTESFDIFYSKENQKCLKNYGEPLKKQLEEMNKKSSKTGTLSFVDEVIQNRQKYGKCKITKGLDIENGWIYLEYLKKLYQICKDSDYFKAGDADRIITDYEAIDQFKRQLPDLEDLQSKKDSVQRKAYFEDKFNMELQEILSTVNTDPVLKKFKQNAPDFIMAEIDENNRCPLVLLFNVLNKKASAFHSDLAFPQNYKFIRKNANVLEVFIGDFELKFAKNGKNSVNAIFVRMIDFEGNTITSKNTVENNFTLQMLCGL